MSELQGILLFSAVIVAIECSVMIIRGKGWGPMSTRLVGLSLVVLASLIIAFSAITADQRAPVFALLGVIAGFLAGKPAGNGEG